MVTPMVLGVEQVGDNLFRVEFNRAGATGTLSINNPERQGIGEITYRVEGSALSENGKFYSYVSIDATDLESQTTLPDGTPRNNCLSYEGKDSILRYVNIENVEANYGSFLLYGNDYNTTMKLEKDILAPIVESQSEVAYDDRGSFLEIHVMDKNPWVADENVLHDVRPVKYMYNDSLLRFDERVSLNQDERNPYFKPVVVSYVDSNGATHRELVSNCVLRPYTGLDINGYEDSLTWNGESNNLNIDLSNYPSLLNEFGQLVAGVIYKVEIPTGYFTDPARDDVYNNYENDFQFNGQQHDLLYVDDGRIVGSSTQAPLGYTSNAYVVNITVKCVQSTYPTVPQTSKELINYNDLTDTLRIEFTGTIDVNTLQDKSNYQINGRTLAQWDALLGTNTVIIYEVKECRQYATFKIPKNSISETADVEFIVRGVRNPQGAAMTPVATVIRLRDNYCPIVVEAAITGDRQLKLRFNEPLRYNVSFVNNETPIKAARNFKVMVNGLEWTVISAVLASSIDETNQREVYLNLGSGISQTAVITVEVRNDQTGVMNIVDNSGFNNPLRLATYML
jgi:hypothetical protein